MNEIKVSLTIVLSGSMMFSKEECLKTTQKVIEKKTKTGRTYKKTIEVQVEDWDKTDKHTMKVTGPDTSDSEIITFHTRKSKPASQSVNICKEAYEYMTSKDGCPPNVKPFIWVKLKPMQRLEAHLKLVCEQLGGSSYTYKVFDD